jgi:dienelactone hydrolase
MSRLAALAVFHLSFMILFPDAVFCQIRVTPAKSLGGEKPSELWAEMPTEFRRSITLPKWPVPDDLESWKHKRRAKTRETLVGLLGDIPPRPKQLNARVTSRQKHNGYSLERFEFHNGVDMVVPGLILIPDKRAGRVPAIIGLHGHGSSKEHLMTDASHHQMIGPELARAGYVVVAIDGYFHGERVGKGLGGERDNKRMQEHSLFAYNLWMGRSLWGMMIRDVQCLIDYLQTRDEVDSDRIGITGMSMGCTLSWWTAAVDDRVACVVGVACFTRYSELLALGNTRKHAMYYFVPGVLKHFDTEAIYSLIAPRPMLQLSGDEDGGAPLAGIETLERKLGHVYSLYDKRENFRSVVYRHTGHEYLPEMRAEMRKWFQEHLPVR